MGDGRGLPSVKVAVGTEKSPASTTPFGSKVSSPVEPSHVHSRQNFAEFYGATKFNRDLCDWNQVSFTAFTTGDDTFFGTSCAIKPDLEGFTNDGTNTAATKACFQCS